MIEVLLFGLSTNRGGIETYLYKIWNNINKEQFHFNFIDMTGEGNVPCFYEEFLATGCKFYKITPRNVSASQNKKDLKKLFTENHFDIFHFNVNTLSYIAPVEEALRAGCKVLVHSRNAGTSNKIITQIFHRINKVRLSKMNVERIAVSYMAGEWLFGESDFDVYHNGIETERYAFSKLERARIRGDMQAEEKIVFGNVGAFVPAKNHKFMVDTFEVLHKKNPNTVLWFIGGGPSKEEMEQYVQTKGLQEAIFFLGVRKDVASLYSAMDVFWLPSLYEGYANVLLEAQCEGLPCIVSDCIPQDALLADNTFSYSLKKGRVEWVEQLLLAAKAQKNDRTNCYKEMEKYGITIDAEIKRLENRYRSIMKS